MSEIHKEINNFWNRSNKKKYEKAMNILINYITQIDEKLYKIYGNHIVRFVENRLKTPESIEEKLRRKVKSVNYQSIEKYINDLAGVRAICFDTKQVYRLVEEIKRIRVFSVIKEKDYILHPKDNGYQSYHIIFGYQDIKIELQIRTILMDAWSSLETILIYKKSVPVPYEIENDIGKFSKWSKKMDTLVEKMLERKVIQ